MSALRFGSGAAAIIGIAAIAGVWAGQTGWLHLPLDAAGTRADDNGPAAQGPVIYYRDPDGRPLYSATPKSTVEGRAFVGVRASEDVKFNGKPSAAAAPTASARKVKYYRNPMGLPDTSPQPKKDSMGMDYIPVYEGENEDGAKIRVSPGKVQRAGVETVVVTRMASSRTIKAPGVVQYDERRIWVVTPRFDGFVERVEPVTTGQHVRKGDALVTVYGQEILAQASRLISELSPGGASPDQRINRGDNGPGSGAARRLHNLGVPDDFIEQLKRDRRVPDTLTLRAPADGIVLERNIVDGQSFKAGDAAFRLADHSVVWVNADVPESEMASIKPGQVVTITTRAHPGRTFKGQVALISPHLMKETRTVRVRIELPNPDLALLPEMYADVEIATGGGDMVVAVPSSALIDSGSRQVVLVSSGEGRYEPRDVNAGRAGDGMVEIVSGLAEGDRVVVNGLFLIDSESNLQAALKGFAAPALSEAKP